jgi:glutamate synthase domain-containing protein 1
MCGILGFLDRRGGPQPLGRTLVAMLHALGCRGPDSAGVAVFAGADSPGWAVNLRPPPGVTQLPPGLALAPAVGIGEYLIFDVPAGGDPAAAEKRLLDALPRSEVISMGRRLGVFKQVGTPDQLDATYGVSRLRGTHGIGHTRLSTESKIDLSHSQPFWAHGVPDLVTVHNGHVTNYHKLRRRYEQKGYRFYTENDSEVIGVYLRDRMSRGLSFEDALRASLDDFDGSFCYLAATPDRLAYVKDRFGFKPLVVAETPDFVAIATEEVALRKALGTGFAAREPAPGSLGVWAVGQEVGVGRNGR